MGGWTLALAATSLWIGILVEGRSTTGIGAGPGAVLLTAGRERSPPTTRASPAKVAGPPGIFTVTAVLVLAFASLGAGWFAIRQAHLEASPLARLNGRSVQIQGSLAADPEAGPLGWTVRIDVAVVRPRTPGWPAELVVHDSVWAEGRGRPPTLEAGDRVVVWGLLDRPGGSFGTYLRHRGYTAALSTSEIRIRGAPANAMLRGADVVRAALRSSLERVFPPREAGLLMGLSLGDTSRLDPNVAEDFRATGLTHLLAVSGENVAMFLAPVLGLAMMLGARRRARFAVGVIAVVFFVLLTRAEPSVLRAAAMATLTMLGIFLGRPRSAPAIMGGAILALLAVDPTLVYAVGFQLSVAATAGMALLAGPIADRLRRLPRGLALAAGTTIAAQAGVTPVLLYYFGAVPTVTLIANVLAFPAVGPAMLLGLLAAALALVPGPLASPVAVAARVPLDYLMGLADRLAKRRCRRSRPAPSEASRCSSRSGWSAPPPGGCARVAGCHGARSSRRRACSRSCCGRTHSPRGRLAGSPSRSSPSGRATRRWSVRPAAPPS